jgi:SOS-response transcriptional repressor LexA
LGLVVKPAHAGGLLAVYSTWEAANGQIVVAHLDDEVTVTRLRRPIHWTQSVQFLAENPAFPTAQVDLRT